VAHQPTRLCIVSRDRLRSGDFIAALRASLRPEDQLEIIMDRRHGGSSGKSDPKEDRRRQLRVDLALEADGFAIVPASVDQTKHRTALSLLLPEAPIERLSPEDAEDEERLESILSFKRRRSGRLIPKLLAVLIGVTLAAFALSPAGQNFGKSLMSRVFQGSPPPSGDLSQPPAQTNEASTVAQLPAVTEEPGVAETQAARVHVGGSRLEQQFAQRGRRIGSVEGGDAGPELEADAAQAIRVARGEDHVGSLGAGAPGRLEADARAAAAFPCLASRPPTAPWGSRPCPG